MSNADEVWSHIEKAHAVSRDANSKVMEGHLGAMSAASATLNNSMIVRELLGVGTLNPAPATPTPTLEPQPNPQ